MFLALICSRFLR